MKAAKRAVPHLIAHKVASTIADAAKERKRVDINVKHSQEPQSKRAFVDTGPDINALIDGLILYWTKMIGESILEHHETNATDESIKSYEYNEYQPITGTQLNSTGKITIIIENQNQFLHLHKLIIQGMQMLIYCRDLQLVYFLMVLTKRLVAEGVMNSI